MAKPDRFPYGGEGVRLIGDDTPARQLDGWLHENVMGQGFWATYGEAWGYRDEDGWNYDREDLLTGAVLDTVPHYTQDSSAYHELNRRVRRVLMDKGMLTDYQNLLREKFNGQAAAPVYFDGLTVLKDFLQTVDRATAFKNPNPLLPFKPEETHV